MFFTETMLEHILSSERKTKNLLKVLTKLEMKIEASAQYPYFEIVKKGG